MSSDAARHIALLKRTFLFGALADALLAEVAAGARERRYARGELIFQKGDRSTGLYVVIAGKIKEACQSTEGAEKIIEIIGTDQTCGEAALLLDCPQPFFAAALVGTHLLHVDRQVVHALIGRAPQFVERLLLRLSGRTVDIIRDIEAYSMKNPLQRVAGFLLDLHGAAAGVHPTVTLPAAKGAIASRLNMTPEALSRTLRDLADARLIDVRGSRVALLDPPRLRDFATA